MPILALSGKRKTGKCLGIDTPILMYDGTVKPVQDIIVGDLLMGPDSQPRRVESLARGRENMYKITPKNGDPWVCNESHILSLKTRHRVSQTKKLPCGNRISCIYSGEVINIPLIEYLLKSPYFKHHTRLWKTAVEFNNQKELLIDPYFLGLWLGDGSSATTQITNIDEEIIAYIYAYAEKLDLKVRIYCKTDTKTTSFNLTKGIYTGKRVKNILLNGLKQYSLIQNKHIPQDYLTASREDRLQILAGLLDTDGSLYRDNVFEIMQKNPHLSKDIVFLARSLGFRVNIKWCKKYCYYKGEKREGDYARISISGEIEQIPTKLKRKQVNYRVRKKDPLVTYFDIKPLGIGDYYGFELSGPDRLFLLGDFTVAHNTKISEIVTRLDARFRKLSFADAVRELFSRETGIGLKSLTDNAQKEEFRERLIQFAESLRAVDELIFIKELFDHIVPDEYIVIDDLRLLRELEYLLKAKAIVYRVEADNHVRKKRGWIYFPEVDEHITETDLDFCQETYVSFGGGVVRNNGTLEELERTVSLILLKYF